MTFQVKAEVLLNNSNWEKNLKKTSKQLDGFGASMKTVANGVKAAWAGIGIVAFGAVSDAIIEMTKAAAEDNKSQKILNKTMENSWKATSKQKDEMDKYIDTMSNMTGIVDDKLRPAMGKIVTVTKDAGKAQQAFKDVLDISAGTGKDVNIVAQAYSKYLGGNQTALDKLIPGLKEAGDKMQFLRDKYGGMAEVSGKNDPFARINVIMDNFKEKLGKSFLPVVNQFADWLASGESQRALDDLAAKVQEFGKWFASPAGQKAFAGWMKDLKDMIKLAQDFLGLVKDVTGFLGSNTGGTIDRKTGYYVPNKENDFSKSPMGQWWEKTFGGKSTPAATGTTNITINGVTNASQVVTELQKLAQKKGIPLSKLLQ